MTTAIDNLTFREFDAVTRDEWMAAIEKSLRAKPLAALTKRSYEGIDLSPVATVEDLAGMPSCDSLPGQYPFRRGTWAGGYHEGPWLIAQELDIPDPRDFNQALRAALAKGQTAVVLGSCPRIETIADLQTALRAIDLRQNPLFLAEDTRALSVYQLLRAAFPAETLARMRGCIGYDPLRGLARTGAAPRDIFERMHQHTQAVKKSSPQLGCIAVRSDVYHDAGASATQELAIVLATGVAYLREMRARAMDVNKVAEKMHFFLSIGENFFMEIAKLRALKMMWAQVVRAFGGDHEAQRIKLHARGGSRNKSPLDAHNNILRATSEAMAAAIAGVDSMTTPPFDAPLGASDEFSRRIARNLQLILQDELRLTKLIDPAGGAWHIEKLTEQLAQAAWKQFQDIEADGGMLAALRAGAIQASIAALARQRRRDLAVRKTALVGSNIYPNLAEPCRNRQARTFYETNAATYTNEDNTLIAAPLAPLRLAADYARLRQNADSYHQAHGRAPSVFIIGLDREPATKAKMQAAFSIYEVGGFACGGGAVYDLVEDALEAALSSQAGACVVCASAAALTRMESFARALEARQAQIVLVASVASVASNDSQADYHDDPENARENARENTCDNENSLRALGVADFVYPDGDCLALNRSLQARMRIGK